MGKANPPDLEPSPRRNHQGKMARPRLGRRGGMCLGGARPREALPGRKQGRSQPGMQQVADRCVLAGVRVQPDPLGRVGSATAQSTALSPAPLAHHIPPRLNPLTLLLFLPPPSRPVGVILQPRPGAEPALHNPCAGGTATTAAAAL